MKLGDALPSFDDVANWLGVRPDRVVADGRPLLVHFWSTRCPLCHEGAESISRWRLRFAPQGLATIAVYQPRATETIDLAGVERDARSAMHIKYPCAVDASGVLAARFNSEYPPGYYLFDRNGELRHRQMGNAKLHRLEALIERLLIKA